jgi:hypothetical protein
MPTSKKSPTKKVAKKSVVKKAPAKKGVKKVTAKKVAKKTAAKKVTKKAVKKTTAKKVTKKTTAKTKAKKALVLASNDKSFWVTNGAVLNSLIALRDALDEMEKEVYSYHVTKEHNDFASWVDVVLCDTQCATELKQAKDSVKAKSVVTRRLKVYSV